MAKKRRTHKAMTASHRNGRKSRGPVTKEGLQRSSQNALRHALSSEVHFVLPGEKPDQFEALVESYRASLRPNGEPEDQIVRNLAVAAWKTRRLDAAEAGAVLASLSNPDEPEPLAKIRTQLKQVETTLPVWNQLIGVIANDISQDEPLQEIAPVVTSANKLLKVTDEIAIESKDTALSELIPPAQHLIALYAGMPPEAPATTWSINFSKYAAPIVTRLSQLSSNLQNTIKLLQEAATLQAAIPANLQRLDRYRRAIERSVKSNLEILRSLRELSPQHTIDAKPQKM